MKNTVLYIHCKGGSASGSEHYKPLFPGCEVIGLDYNAFTPWETGKEIHAAVENLKTEYDNIISEDLMREITSSMIPEEQYAQIVNGTVG